MTRRYPSALTVSWKLVRGLIILNWVVGFLIFMLLVASLVAEQRVMAALGADPAESGPMLIDGMRRIMLIGILSVPLAHLLLTRLLAIVETVRGGDPFVAANAARLEVMAWALLGLELLHLTAGIVAALASTESAPLDIDWSFSVTRWLAVLLLFVLARVFDHGARMRADLEGTI